RRRALKEAGGRVTARPFPEVGPRPPCPPTSARSSGEEVGGFFGKFHGTRKVDNSFLGRAAAYRYCSLCRSLDLRLWFPRLSHSVRPFPTANRAKSFPSLFR